MSKLAKAIELSMTGNVKASRDLKLRYTDVIHEMRQDPVWLSKEYISKVVLQHKFMIDEYTASKSNFDYHREVQNTIKRAMIEEVFGEFRPYIVELRAAIYDSDTDRMRTLLAELEHKMFVEGTYD